MTVLDIAQPKVALPMTKHRSGYTRTMPVRLLAQSAWISGCLFCGCLAQVIANLPG